MGDQKPKNEWIRKLIHSISYEERKNVISYLSESSYPKFDFFLLVVLSSAIATLGLINDSAAVIIGAMLLAPLMSPIIGIGLATMTGNSKLAKNAASALVRGALLSVFIAVLITFANRYLPFVSSFFLDLPKEIVNRTQPTPYDLIIALAGGIAAAYAMTHPKLSAALPGVAIATALMPPLCTIGIGIGIGRWDVTGGAFLLFLTNSVTIAFGASLVFFFSGFSPVTKKSDEPKIPHSLTAAAIFTALLLISLSLFSWRFFSQSQATRQINSVIESEVSKINGSEIIELTTLSSEGELKLEITLRTNKALTHSQVISLQQALVNKLNQPISLVVNQVLAEQLDPLNPPTPTPTNTLGPSPTPTNTTTSTPTRTATSTFTPTSTLTSTPTTTSLPEQARVITSRLFTYINLYQSPGGPTIAQLKPNDLITMLYNTEIYDGLVWIEVMDSEGRLGWIPAIQLATLTPTSTPNN